ncbi:MAG: cytidyltransferase [Candidatus Firestonebacteria bacterium RIFOXYA2_FULL_40_8]|nr:MAG: cytidyltransferase [Candidatus Firestonebacteria bacterium RIFOXYA2_FULL_40_8]
MVQKTGLTLGKYAPLHKGHQYIIETALKEVNTLIILVYDCPETIDVPLKVRADWIRKLYPKAEVIEARGGPMEVGDTPEIKKKNEDYILKILNGRKITHFYCSEFYGDHMSRALNAKNRTIDKERNMYNISGTLIRTDYYKYREYIDPVVYSGLIVNAVFLGAPSTGKTTLTSALAGELNTAWMPEYGREYWAKNNVNRRLTLEQLVDIAEIHLKKENEMIFNAKKVLLTDTNAITTYLFSFYYHGKAHSRLKELADQAGSRYDLVFLCDIDIPYDNTADRSGETNRIDFHEKTIAYLQKKKINFVLVKGSLKDRIELVKDKLKSYKKYC